MRHLSPGTDEMARPGYRENGRDRCFHCKATLLDTLRPLAAELGLAHVATGTNADDAVAGFRPGIAAAAQRGALTPLLDAGLTKAQVREASRRWGLVTADKPAMACLSSRIAYGVEVTPTRLARVDRAETALRTRLGAVGDLRVRDLGDGMVRAGAALFGLGGLGVLLTVLPYFFGDRQPALAWLVLALMTPFGLGLALLGLLRGARASGREST